MLQGNSDIHAFFYCIIYISAKWRLRPFSLLCCDNPFRGGRLPPASVRRGVVMIGVLNLDITCQCEFCRRARHTWWISAAKAPTAPTGEGLVEDTTTSTLVEDEDTGTLVEAT